MTEAGTGVRRKQLVQRKKNCKKRGFLLLIQSNSELMVLHRRKLKRTIQIHLTGERKGHNFLPLVSSLVSYLDREERKVKHRKCSQYQPSILKVKVGVFPRNRKRWVFLSILFPLESFLFRQASLISSKRVSFLPQTFVSHIVSELANFQKNEEDMDKYYIKFYLGSGLLSDQDNIPGRVVYRNIGNVKPSRREPFKTVNKRWAQEEQALWFPAVNHLSLQLHSLKLWELIIMFPRKKSVQWIRMKMTLGFLSNRPELESNLISFKLMTLDLVI